MALPLEQNQKAQKSEPIRCPEKITGDHEGIIKEQILDQKDLEDNVTAAMVRPWQDGPHAKRKIFMAKNIRGGDVPTMDFIL